MVGALPVGMETKGYEDTPYWPTQICWTYKEVWTAPVGQWIWLMNDISVPATVRGIADPGNKESVEFREEKSGQLVTVAPASFDGSFNIRLPEGRYEVRHGSAHTSLTVLPGGVYSLDLTADRILDFKLSYQAGGKNEITVRVSMIGGGDHRFSIRSDNLALSDAGQQSLHLTSGIAKEIVWHAHVISPETPWVALVVPDGDLSKRGEVTGANMPRNTVSLKQ
jgi:hypothetical protein